MFIISFLFVHLFLKEVVVFYQYILIKEFFFILFVDHIQQNPLRTEK